MSDLPEQKVGKRRISNAPPSQTADNSIEKNPNNENKEDTQLDVNKGPDQKINVNNLEQLPAPSSKEQILSTPNSNPIPQNVLNNQYTNSQNQFQQVPIPIVNPSFVANQMYPQNPNVIIISQMAPLPVMTYNDRYTPTSLMCPYCMKQVTSVPSAYWSCRSCDACFCLVFLYYISLGLGLFIDLCLLACRDGDFCCYEADHRCPYCNNIIARRELRRRYC